MRQGDEAVKLAQGFQVVTIDNQLYGLQYHHE